MTTPNLAAFGFAEEYQAVYDMSYRYARAELYDLAPRMDKEDWFPEAQFRALGAQGLLGATIPNEYGGAGLDVLAQCFICEAVSYWNHSFAASLLASDNLCVHNLVRNANQDQKNTYLPRFADGRAIGALGMTEPGAGSDALGSMATTARRDGNDYVLNGRKLFITNGPVADVLLVYAKTAPDKKQHGISAFIVENSFAGFRVAQKLDKMGWRGSPTGELVFDECRVPAGNRVGAENKGVGIMMSGLDQPLTYDIDLSQAPGARITHLQYGGQAIGDSEVFIVAINNYRQSGGGNFPNVTTAPVVYNKQLEIRQLLIDWVTAAQVIDPSTFSKTNPDWQLTYGDQALTITP